MNNKEAYNIWLSKEVIEKRITLEDAKKRFKKKIDLDKFLKVYNDLLFQSNLNKKALIEIRLQTSNALDRCKIALDRAQQTVEQWRREAERNKRVFNVLKRITSDYNDITYNQQSNERHYTIESSPLFKPNPTNKLVSFYEEQMQKKQTELQNKINYQKQLREKATTQVNILTTEVDSYKDLINRQEKLEKLAKDRNAYIALLFLLNL